MMGWAKLTALIYFTFDLHVFIVIYIDFINASKNVNKKKVEKIYSRKYTKFDE